MEPSKTTSNLSDYQDLPDGPLPPHIIQRLSARLQGILKNANITTCHSFLELTFDIVLKLEKPRPKTWSEIKNEKPFILQYLLDLKANLPLSQKKLSNPSLPLHIIKRLSVRLQNVLKDNEITNCRAFLDLKSDVVLSWRKAGSKTWQEIKDEKPYIFQYLQDLKTDSHPAQTSMPDRPLPQQIIEHLPVRLQGILRNADISTCNEFLNLDHDFVLSLTQAGKKTWHDIEDAKPIVSQYLLAPKEVPSPSFSGLPDRPFPPYLIKRLPVRAQNFLRNLDISTCHAFLELNSDSVLSLTNAGKKTWQDLEGMKPEVNRFLREGEFWTMDHQAFDSYESFLSAFLKSFPKINRAEIILDHRLAIRGTGEDKTLEKTASFLKVTRERIRQMEKKVCRLYFEEEGRSLVAPFLKATREILAGECGAASPEALIGKIEKVTGWKNSHPRCVVNFLRCFGEVEFDDDLQIVFVPDIEADASIKALTDKFEPFCQDENRGYAELSFDCFVRHINKDDLFSQHRFSFETYRRLGRQLLRKNILPSDKQKQLKAFVDAKAVSFREVGDKRRPVQKILSVLQNAKRPLSITDWVTACQQLYPAEGFSVNQIRRAMNYPEVINYDRGKYIWHENVSIAASLVKRFEDDILKHFQRFNVNVVSVFKFFENNKVILAESGIPTLTLLYFLLKRNSSGRLVYPEYPKVALPDAEGGAGVFNRIMRDKLFIGRGVAMDELHAFYGNVLCADPRLIMAIPDLTRRGALYFLDSCPQNDGGEKVPAPPVRDRDAKAMLGAESNSEERPLITALLEERFRNGFRLDSEIDAVRFQESYKKKYGCASSLTGTELRDLIGSIGVRHAGKVFILSSEVKRSLGELVQNAFACGARSVFYSSFYERHEEMLSAVHIHSAAMLRDVLISLHPQLHFEHAYFSQDDSARPEDEVARCFDEGRPVYTHAQLAEILPYMPAHIIKRLLYRSNSVVSLSTSSRYAHISQVNITEDDRRKTADFIEERLQKSEYVSLLDLDVSQIQARNPEFSEAALRNVLYRLCCDDEYRRDGNIISKSDVPFNALDILKQYCLDRDEVTLAELVAEELKFTKNAHGVGLMAASQVMVRKDRETFIADRYVVFDIGRTDKILGRFCPCEYIPLQTVADFSLFPYPGYPWNRFLLESFARRFSQTFRVEGVAVNSLAAGVIVRKSATFTDYKQILADAVAKADIPLEEADVVGFLCEKGYLCRKVFGGTESVIAEAALRRERGF